MYVCAYYTQVIEELDPGIEYAFQLRAVNRFGAGEPTEPIKVVTKCDVPSAPVQLQSFHRTASSVMLRWSRPATDSGSEIVGYTVRMRTHGRSSWDIVAEDISALAVQIDGLDHSSRHDVSVRARNALGWSNWSHQVTVETLPQNPPAPPRVLVACASQNNVSICWRHDEVSSCVCLLVCLLLGYACVASAG